MKKVGFLKILEIVANVFVICVVLSMFWIFFFVRQVKKEPPPVPENTPNLDDDINNKVIPDGKG